MCKYRRNPNYLHHILGVKQIIVSSIFVLGRNIIDIIRRHHLVLHSMNHLLLMYFGKRQYRAVSAFTLYHFCYNDMIIIYKVKTMEIKIMQMYLIFYFFSNNINILCFYLVQRRESIMPLLAFSYLIRRISIHITPLSRLSL